MRAPAHSPSPRSPARLTESGSARVLIALLGIPVAAALLFREFFRESLVVPLLYALWLGYEYVRSLPQAALWGLFLFLGFLWMLRSWPRPVRAEARRRAKAGAEAEGSPGRVAAWRERIRLAHRSRGGYGARFLGSRLGRLALQVLADGRRVEPAELRRRILEGDLNGKVPDEALPAWQALQALLLGGEGSSKGRPRDRTSRPLNLEPLLRLLEEELRLAHPKTSSVRSESEKGGYGRRWP